MDKYSFKMQVIMKTVQVMQIWDHFLRKCSTFYIFLQSIGLYIYSTVTNYLSYFFTFLFMKKLFSFLLIFVIFVPTIWAYNLTDKDEVVIQKASIAIEKMITRKWENYRAKYITALQKLQLRFQNNLRMQKIIIET